MATRAYLSAIAVLLIAAVGLQVWRDRGWQPYEPATPVMWLRAGPMIKRAALGYDAIVADIYWMRAVVYFGQRRLSARADKNYDLLHPMLDLVTTLDPRFVVAYRFGAIFLSEPPPGGPGRPDLAIDLLQRGFERAPARWEYPRDIGFVYYWHHRDFQKAAEWFQRAAAIPGAPVWLTSTAAASLTRGGDRASARQLWQQLYDSADVDSLKNAAAVRLAQFNALDRIDTLNEIVWRYQARTGRFPASWQELVAAGVLPGVPIDPTRLPYVLDPVNEDVRISQDSELWPLPEGFDAVAP
jgi:hypothetical protein